MKAKPVRLIHGKGYEQCAVEDATHVSLRIPGPTGLLTLPVIRNGTRNGTGCWTWNGSTDAPTLRPSVLTQYDGADGAWRCHSWINDGAAQFLADSTHSMAGTTVLLLDVDAIPAGGLSALTEVLGAVLTYRTTGHNRPCGQTIGANGLGEYVVMITGDPVDAEQAAREYLRNLERNGYRITEAILVTNEEAYSGKPISVIHATHNTEAQGRR